MKFFLGALLLIIVVVCLGVVIFLCKDGMIDVKKNPKKAMIAFGVVLVGGLCSLGACGILGVFDSSTAEQREKEENRQKIQACNQLTNTYQKCSWSAWENRCVCKQR